MPPAGVIGRLARLSVAARMAALTSGALIALLVLVGVLVHRQFGSALREEVDRELTDVARVAAVAVEDARGRDLSELLGSELGDITAAATSGLQAQVISATGAVVAASDALVGVERLVRGGALVRVADVPVYGDATVKGRSYRFVAVSVEDGSGRIVAVAAPIDDLVDAEKTLLAAYVSAAAGAAVVAALAGWWIAKRSLAPLRNFAAEAEAIGALDLSQRLSAPAASDEIGRLGVTLNRMLDRLEAAWERERRLTAKVGHELRTPLAIIRAELELLLDGPGNGNDVVRAAAMSVLEEVDRIIGVIEDMLLLARADAGAMLDLPEPVDLGELARRAAERFSGLAATKAVTLGAHGDARIEGDPHAIERAVTNLLDNALRHTPEGGEVEIEVAQHDKGALLVVRDTGPGAAPEVLGRMFDRYARAGPRRGAAGLGLSIVAAVAASHEGNVRARNRPEGGLEVTVELR